MSTTPYPITKTKDQTVGANDKGEPASVRVIIDGFGTYNK